MKSLTTLTSLVLVIVSTIAHPPSRRDSGDIDDIAVLNFALTLEHLENAFYTQGLAQFDDAAFQKAGYPAYTRGRFVQVGDHEKTHVDFLTKVLGDKATNPCEYNFPYKDVKGFIALSQTFEGVGVTAYSGAAKLITNKDYLTAAAVVLSTEARHAAWVASAVPLSPSQVFTLAGAFIKSCPSTNPVLPIIAYPSLTITPFPSSTGTGATKVVPGQQASFAFTHSSSSTITSSTPLFVAFFTGLDTVFAPLTAGGDGKTWIATIPGTLRGTVYAVVSMSGESAADGKDIVAGPGILDFEVDSRGQLA